YASLPSDALHIIRDEYKWIFEVCGSKNEEQIKYIEKTLSLRGESLAVRLNRKVLFLCECGQSRIVTTSVPEDEITMFIFEQYKVVCPKCRTSNMYTWKYMD
ncbi:MAG: hypothetical protein K2M91_11080, partial [Lachnospiraceae bacterium]|nr:hypothetical protein [Lachnospiraceae bacterium]